MREASLDKVSQRVRYRHLQHDPHPVAARSLARRLGHMGSFCRTGLARNLLAPRTASWRGKKDPGVGSWIPRRRCSLLTVDRALRVVEMAWQRTRVL